MRSRQLTGRLDNSNNSCTEPTITFKVYRFMLKDVTVFPCLLLLLASQKLIKLILYTIPTQYFTVFWKIPFLATNLYELKFYTCPLKDSKSRDKTAVLFANSYLYSFTVLYFFRNEFFLMFMCTSVL